MHVACERICLQVTSDAFPPAARYVIGLEEGWFDRPMPLPSPQDLLPRVNLADNKGHLRNPPSLALLYVSQFAFTSTAPVELLCSFCAFDQSISLSIAGLQMADVE